MMPAPLCPVLLFALAAAVLTVAAATRHRATATAAFAWCTAAYLTTAVTVIVGGVHA